MSVERTSAGGGPEESAEVVDGGPEEHKASGEFNNDGPTLEDEVSAGGNRVRRAEPVEKLV